MEHFSRKTTRACTELIVVSDETEVGLRSASRIFELIEELEIPARRKFLVINRASGKEVFKDALHQFSVEKVFQVPFDPELMTLSAQGRPLNGLSKDSSALSALRAWGDEVWPKN
jgi:CO dehydrogenase maturation factor